MDSFGIIETVMFLESTFDVRITRADVNGANFKNIATLAAFVVARRAG